MIDADTTTTPTDLIALVRVTSAALRERETELVLLAVAWADAHPDLDTEREPWDQSEDRDPHAPDRESRRWRGMRGRRSLRLSGCRPVQERR